MPSLLGRFLSTTALATTDRDQGPQTFWEINPAQRPPGFRGTTLRFGGAWQATRNDGLPHRAKNRSLTVAARNEATFRAADVRSCKNIAEIAGVTGSKKQAALQAAGTR